MKIKIKDLFNQKINKNNGQISLDLKKRELRKHNLNIDEILDFELKKFMKKDG